MFLLAKVFKIPPFPFGGGREIYISRNSYENGHANKILENRPEGREGREEVYGGGEGRSRGEGWVGGGRDPYYELYRHIHYPDFAFVCGLR